MIALRALQLYRNSPIERYREQIVQRTRRFSTPSTNDVERRESAHLFFSDKTITEHKSYRSLCIFFVSSSSSSVLLGDDRSMREKLDDDDV